PVPPAGFEPALTAPERVAVCGPDQRKHARRNLVRARIGATCPGPGPRRRAGGRDSRTPAGPSCQARSHPWLARPPASLADFLADGPAPSWFVRVGTCLALHFPGNHRLCLDRPGRLVGELGRRLFAILPGPAAKETHSAAKETHSGSIGRRLADFSHPEGRSAGMSKGFVCTRGDRTSGPAASTAITGRPNGPQGPQGPKGGRVTHGCAGHRCDGRLPGLRRPQLSQWRRKNTTPGSSGRPNSR